MPIPTTDRPRESALPAWLLLPTAVGLLAGGGLAVTWANREPPAPEAPTTAARLARLLPQPTTDDRGVYSVTEAVEHGVRVLKVRVTAGGDELVVDAETGRLIEARPPRPTAAPLTPGFLAP
jgi:hypothetical protein